MGKRGGETKMCRVNTAVLYILTCSILYTSSMIKMINSVVFNHNKYKHANIPVTIKFKNYN